MRSSTASKIRAYTPEVNHKRFSVLKKILYLFEHKSAQRHRITFHSLAILRNTNNSIQDRFLLRIGTTFTLL